METVKQYRIKREREWENSDKTREGKKCSGRRQGEKNYVVTGNEEKKNTNRQDINKEGELEKDRRKQN